MNSNNNHRLGLNIFELLYGVIVFVIPFLMAVKIFHIFNIDGIFVYPISFIFGFVMLFVMNLIIGNLQDRVRMKWYYEKSGIKNLNRDQLNDLLNKTDNKDYIRYLKIEIERRGSLN